MAESTGISWCDATFNPWVGCTKVSPGCKHCYAETMVTGRMGRGGTWGPGGTRERTSAALWRKPLRWNELAAAGLLPDGTENPDGHRPRIFCASLADVFEPRPELLPWRAELFDLIASTPNLDWLVLTKRPDYAAGWLSGWFAQGVVREYPPTLSLLDDTPWTYRDGIDWGVLPNLWVGTSIESTAYTWRADWLRLIPAPVRFISAEPLLGSLFTLPLAPSGGSGVGQAEAMPSAAEPPDVARGSVNGEAADGNRTETDASRDVDELQPLDVSVSGSTPELSTPEDRVLPGIPGGVTVQPDAQSAIPSEGSPHARARLDGSRSEIDRGAADTAARGQAAPLDLTGIDWVIVGGESGGRNARPMHPDWAREIRDAVLYDNPRGPRHFGATLLCDPTPVLLPPEGTRAIALHFKQWGSWTPSGGGRDLDPHVTPEGRLLTTNDLSGFRWPPESVAVRFAGAPPKSGGKLLDGVEWCEFPDPSRAAVPA